MSIWARFFSPTPNCFFMTGTGRCGTMLLSRVLSCGTDTTCEHEGAVHVTHLNETCRTGHLGGLEQDVAENIVPKVNRHQASGGNFGISSAHLFPVFPILYDLFGRKARFILLVRRPDTFVYSALARGFFDPGHPNGFEEVFPQASSEAGRAWPQMSPFEKCLWYWGYVNRMIWNWFQTLPEGLWRVQKIEALDLSAVESLFTFLGIPDFAEHAHEIRDILNVKVNATPGSGNNIEVNPYSIEKKIEDISTWSTEQKTMLERWCAPLSEMFYPELCAYTINRSGIILSDHQNEAREADSL